MNLTVQLFAAAKDAAGSDRVSVFVAKNATVADLRTELVHRYPGLSAFNASLLIAVNSQYASADQILNPTDEIACFPPVSGG